MPMTVVAILKSRKDDGFKIVSRVAGVPIDCERANECRAFSISRLPRLLCNRKKPVLTVPVNDATT
jgi:hypothetical protein